MATLLLEDKMMGIFDNIDLRYMDDTLMDDDEGVSPFINNAIGEVEKDIINKYWGYDIETGASKVVVIPRSDCPYVIKIPMSGVQMTEYDCDGGEEVVAKYFKGADSEDGWDYCQAEVNYYELAEEAGMEKYFAATIKWKDTKGGYPLYLQEKVEWFSHVEPSRKSMDLAKVNCCGDIRLDNVEWIAAFLDWYGLDEYKKLLAFIENWGINDLHGGNIGYRKNGAPVIFDYSGWNEGNY